MSKLERIYRNLTNKQLAVLAFNHVLRGDEVEVEKIASAAPRKSYSCPDAEYTSTLDTFFQIAQIWSVDYWKARCLVFETIYHWQAAVQRNAKGDAKAFLEVIKNNEGQVLALFQAMKNVCEEHGLSFESIRGFSEADPYDPLFDGVPNVEAQAEYERTLRNSIESPCGVYLCPPKKDQS
jgi:hypothetical protein